MTLQVITRSSRRRPRRFDRGSACVDMRFDELREGQAVTFDKGARGRLREGAGQVVWTVRGPPPRINPHAARRVSEAHSHGSRFTQLPIASASAAGRMAETHRVC